MVQLVSLRCAAPENLESRIVLDGSAMCGFVDFPDSEWVVEHPDGTSLRFASLVVGRRANVGGAEVLLDDALVNVRGRELSVAQVKEYLHGFADTIGTNQFPEFLDLRFAEWGTGSSPTFQNFEDYVEEQAALIPECEGLRFSTDVRFEVPGEVEEPFFSNSWLELPLEGPGTLLTQGDIAEFVEGYEISPDGESLTIQTHIRDLTFVINSDGSLKDSFGAIWLPEGEYEVLDPNAVDQLLGDIDDDGTVGFSDFLILSGDFGTQATASDLDCDGEVSFADFLILSANFGRSIS